MFYDNIEKLNEIEKKVSENLSTADCLNDTSSVKELRPIWINYRGDMATMIGILREYKELITHLKKV